jgi:integrase
MRRILTPADLRWNGTDCWKSDGGARGEGRLAARIQEHRVLLYFRYRADGQNRAIPIGTYSPTGNGGLKLADARAKCRPLADLLRAGVTDLHAHLRREQEAREHAARQAEEAARRAAEESKRGTLAQLCDAYVDHLERQNKQSVRDVKSLFTLHVKESDPELSARRAAEIDPEVLAGLIGKLVDGGKGRTAAKLRSYLRRAYALAAASHTDPSAPLGLRSFGIRTNPLEGIPALSKFNRARDRVLSGPELGALLRHIEALPEGHPRDALLLTLRLGGQRPAQLLRVTAKDVDLDAETITLRDPKGKRNQPRLHVLPLVPEALSIVERRLAGLSGDDKLFSMTPEALSAAVADMSTELVKAETAREPFQLRDLRRTCETMLASLSVSSDVRAQLQSHGLGGVQNRHYDRHDYAPEKKRTLELWAAHLKSLKEGTDKQSNVVPLKRPASA